MEDGSSENVPPAIIETFTKLRRCGLAYAKRAEEIRRLRKLMKNHRESLEEWMSEQDEESVIIAGGTLKKRTSEKAVPLKREYIENTVRENAGTPNAAAVILDALYTSRPKKRQFSVTIVDPVIKEARKKARDAKSTA